uniref:C2H2-type domain-containing protein n=1 Tax=Trichogramma kaykai TaxID=54128 RepID=A0ABD2X5J3_9HYME
MAPLSRALSGIILPHNYYGDHLDARKETIDEDLEKKNFSKAGEVLGEIWSQMVIDNYPVTAKFISDDEILEPVLETNWAWHKEHVRESQYFLQIVKCDDRNCCSDFKSNINIILKDHFLSPPLLLKRQKDGRLTLADPTTDTKGTFFLSLFQRLSIQISCDDPNFCELPYDYHCLSVRESLIDRTCSFCDTYFATMKNAVNHRKIIHPKCPGRIIDKKIKAQVITQRENEALCIINEDDHRDAEWCDIEQFIAMDVTVNNQEPVKVQDLPVIKNIKEWLICDWTED